MNKKYPEPVGSEYSDVLRHHRVPDVGFEPTRPFGQSILSAPRLPFRQSGSSAHAVLKTIP